MQAEMLSSTSQFELFFLNRHISKAATHNTNGKCGGGPCCRLQFLNNSSTTQVNYVSGNECRKRYSVVHVNQIL